MINSYDLFLLIMLVSFTILGLYWGLIRQVLAVAGVVVGVILAGRFGPEVAGWLSSFIGNPQLTGGLGFLIVMLTVSSLASLLATLLHFAAGLLFLGWLDHILGAVLGLLQAILAGAALTIAFVAFPVPFWSDWLIGSRVAGIVVQLGGMLFWFLPNEFQSVIPMLLGR